MAQLLIIVGFASANWREEEPKLVYAGHDDAAGEQAIAESECEFFFQHRNLGAAHRRVKPPVVEETENEDSDETKPSKKTKRKAGK